MFILFLVFFVAFLASAALLWSMRLPGGDAVALIGVVFGFCAWFSYYARP